MRVLMFAWEFQPHIVGGLGRHVTELLAALGELPGVEVHLITPAWAGGQSREQIGQVVVHRVQPPAVEGDPYQRAWQTNLTLKDYARLCWDRHGPFDVVHVHDWLVAAAGIACKHQFAVPLISTVHATERGRQRGQLGNELSRAIDHTEWWLVYESWRVIVCSHFMAKEVVDSFDCPRDKIDVVPNGVRVDPFERFDRAELNAVRALFAEPDEELIFSVGRIVYEKGFHILVEALPNVFSEFPAAKAVIAGEGPELDSLATLAQRLGLGGRAAFVGFTPDEQRDALFKNASCAVFPSLYEPFGIVALEAMAAKCPVIVSDVGGFSDVVCQAETGIRVCPNDPDSLACGILHTLGNRQLARERARKAYHQVYTCYDWSRIGRLTADIYARVIDERARTNW